MEDSKKSIMVDVFGGSGIVSINCNNSAIVYNDKFKGVYNFFKVLRRYDETLIKSIQLTPYSEQEYIKCRDNWQFEEDSIEKARMFYVATMQSRNAIGAMGFKKTHWRRSTNKIRNGMLQSVSSWRTNTEENLPNVVSKLKSMQLENMDAIDCINKYDNDNVVLYVDPPYLPDTREAKKVYEHEYTYENHKELVDRLSLIRSSCILSGNDNELYDRLLELGWKKQVFCDITKTSSNGNNGKKPKAKEVIWYKI
ncbi:DNA adenine methylase [Paraclostridium bifermentans]|nr:DNA adenine methylase [Paraclostridium bifermentans]